MKRALTPYGKKVKMRMIEMEMTRRELAKLVGCDERYLSEIFCGTKGGRMYKPRIAKALRMEDEGGLERGNDETQRDRQHLQSRCPDAGRNNYDKTQNQRRRAIVHCGGK